uniref:Uncharacterized protein n=1 Tax=Caulobacter sp. (strain K31) TaxID=366602 RepID=B0SVI5_CAUSK
MRRTAGILLCTFGFASLYAEARAADAPENKSVAFPVQVEAPETTEGDGSAADGGVFRQRIRSLKAVELRANDVAEYQPAILDRKFAKGGVRAVPISAGDIFVLALSGTGEMYCRAGADRPQGGLTFYDVTVCYRDADQDGVFESRAIVEPHTRTRTAYELVGLGDAVWTPVSIPYAALPADRIPSGELRIDQYRRDKSKEAVANVHVCWPAALTYDVVGKGKITETCGSALWNATGGLENKNGSAVLATNKSGPQTVTWGPLQASFAFDGQALKVSVQKYFSPGPSIAYVAGFMRSTGDYRFQNTIFGLRRLVAVGVPLDKTDQESSPASSPSTRAPGV